MENIFTMKAYVKLVKEINKIPRKSTLDDKKSIKELCHDALDSDPKYKNNHE